MSINDQQDFSEVSAAHLDKIMNRIAGLIRQAEHPNTGKAEAEAFRAKAEGLMNKYRIAEEQARENLAPMDRMAPTFRKIRVTGLNTAFRQQYYSMMYYVADHCGIMINLVWGSDEDGTRAVYAEAVGYDSDVRFAEMLYNAAYLAFQANVDPSFNKSMTEAENIFTLRAAGWTRRKIAVLLWGIEVDHSVPAHGKVQKIYEAECAKRGINPLSGRGVSRAKFTKVFSEEFVAEFYRRLARSRMAVDGGALVLKSRRERVAEAFYQRYPHLRPQESSEKGAVYVDDRTPAQKRRDQARWEREAIERDRLRYSAEGQAGRDAGKRAANTIPLAGVETKGRIKG